MATTAGLIVIAGGDRSVPGRVFVGTIIVPMNLARAVDDDRRLAAWCA
jgi:hypothetical protein